MLQRIPGRFAHAPVVASGLSASRRCVTLWIVVRTTVYVVAAAALSGCGSVSVCTPKEQEFYDLVWRIDACVAANPELADFLIGLGVAPGAGSTRSCAEVAEGMRETYEALQAIGATDVYPTYESYLASMIANGRQAYEGLCR